MAKQELKRNGRPIDELDRLCDSLRDSLNLIRTALVSMQPPDHGPEPVSGNRHASVVDRIRRPDMLTGAGAVAAVVVVGFLAFRVFGRKRPGRSQRQDAPSGRQFEDFHRTTFGPAAPKENDGIDELRQRVATQAAAVPDRVPPGLSGRQTVAEHPAAQPEELREAVRAAATGGMSVAEISRKFQISIDHVNLLLKVVGKKDL